MRLLDRLRLQPGAVKLVIGSVVVDLLLRPKRLRDLDRLFQHPQPLPGRRKLDVPAAVLVLVPARPVTEVDPAAGNHVRRRGDLGVQRRIAVGVAAGQQAEPEPLRVRRQRGQHRPPFKTRPDALVTVDRVQVIEEPAVLECRDVVGFLPDGQDLLPRRMLLGGLEPEAEWTHA